LEAPWSGCGSLGLAYTLKLVLPKPIWDNQIKQYQTIRYRVIYKLYMAWHGFKINAVKKCQKCGARGANGFTILKRSEVHPTIWVSLNMCFHRPSNISSYIMFRETH
jgi:hypothetical protein